MSKHKTTVIPHHAIQEVAAGTKHNFAQAKSFNSHPSDGAYGVPQFQVNRGSQQGNGKDGMQTRPMSSFLNNSGGTGASAGKGNTNGNEG